MTMLRNLAALVALACLCVFAACGDGPTTSPAAPNLSTAPQPTSTTSDSTAIAPPCRDGTGTFGSGNRC